MKGEAHFDLETLNEMRKDMVLKKKIELAAIIRKETRGTENPNLKSFCYNFSENLYLRLKS